MTPQNADNQYKNITCFENTVAGNVSGRNVRVSNVNIGDGGLAGQVLTSRGKSLSPTWQPSTSSPPSVNSIINFISETSGTLTDTDSSSLVYIQPNSGVEFVLNLPEVVTPGTYYTIIYDPNQLSNSVSINSGSGNLINFSANGAYLISENVIISNSPYQTQNFILACASISPNLWYSIYGSGAYIAI